jgi:hypothetical protein
VEQDKQPDGFSITYKVGGLIIAGNIGFATIANALHLPKDHPLDFVFFVPKGMLATSSTASTMSTTWFKP